MKSVVFKKENGEVRIINADEESVRKISSDYTNPCSECIKGYANKCPKMTYGHKKNIANYDFITDGYQVNNENGEFENLVVCKCENFEKDKPRNKSLEELKKMKKLAESIKIFYFSAVDVEEANKIQNDLRNRGLLIDYNPSLKKTHR